MTCPSAERIPELCTHRFHGTGIVVRSNDALLLRWLAGHFRFNPFADVQGRGSLIISAFRASGRYLLTTEGGGRLSARSRREALHLVAGRIHLELAQRCPERTFVHAGVVAFGERMVVLPGRSCSGKTSLVCACLRRGATYFSDEYAAFDSDGRVHPYPRPLQLRDATREATWLTRLPADFGAPTATGPLSPALLLFARYRDGGTPSTLSLSPGLAFLHLLENSVSVRARTSETLQSLRWAALAAPAYEMRRGESDECVNRILELLEQPPLGRS